MKQPAEFCWKKCFISYSKTILACMWDFNIDPVRLKVGETQRMLALLNTVMNNCLKVLLMTQSKVDLNVREREKISRITENFTSNFC